MSWDDFNSRSQKVKVEERDNVVIVRMSSPENLNALSSKVLDELDDLVNLLWYSEGKSGVVIVGEGKAFSAGADVSELYALENVHQAYEYLRRGQRVFSKIENLKYITVAAIDGWALGGGLELALSCTFRVATKSARLGLPEINLGILPGYGGTQRLTRLVGLQRAKRMIMDGVHMGADEALQIGIVDVVCEGKEALIPTAVDLVKRYEGKNPTALRYINELCNMAVGGHMSENLKTEALFCASALFTPLARRKISEFLEKRKK